MICSWCEKRWGPENARTILGRFWEWLKYKSNALKECPGCTRTRLAEVYASMDAMENIIAGRHESFFTPESVNLACWLRDWARKNKLNYGEIVYDIYYWGDSTRTQTVPREILERAPKDLGCSWEDLVFAVEGVVRHDMAGFEITD